MKNIIILFLLCNTALVFSTGNNENIQKDVELTPLDQMERPEGGMTNDLSEAAEKLGVTVEYLMEVLPTPEDATPETIREAAAMLGITEEELLEVLGPPQGSKNGDRNGQQPPKR